MSSCVNSSLNHLLPSGVYYKAFIGVGDEERSCPLCQYNLYLFQFASL